MDWEDRTVIELKCILYLQIMAKSREGFTVHIKLSGKKNGTDKAVVKLASIFKKKQGRMRRLEQVRI